MNRSPFLFLLVALLAPIPSVQAQIQVAVAHLKAEEGISESQSRILSDLLRTELAATRAFQVMNREDMESVLKEIRFQQTGLCSDNSCLVEMGQALGVRKMVTGSIGLLEGSYFITVKMVDVASFKTDVSASEVQAKGTGEQLQGMLRRLADKLAEGRTVSSLEHPTATPTPTPVQFVTPDQLVAALNRPWPAGHEKIVQRVLKKMKFGYDKFAGRLEVAWLDKAKDSIVHKGKTNILTLSSPRSIQLGLDGGSPRIGSVPQSLRMVFSTLDVTADGTSPSAAFKNMKDVTFLYGTWRWRVGSRYMGYTPERSTSGSMIYLDETLTVTTGTVDLIRMINAGHVDGRLGDWTVQLDEPQLTAMSECLRALYEGKVRDPASLTPLKVLPDSFSGESAPAGTPNAGGQSH